MPAMPQPVCPPATAEDCHSEGRQGVPLPADSSAGVDEGPLTKLMPAPIADRCGTWALPAGAAPADAGRALRLLAGSVLAAADANFL